MKNGYKVVDRNNYSVMALMNAVRYEVGIKTVPEPNCGPLCVFSTIDNASAYYKNMCLTHDKIYKCKYDKSDEVDVWKPNRERVPIGCLPIGTRLADSVTLTDEMHYNKATGRWNIIGGSQ